VVNSAKILGCRVDATSHDQVCEHIAKWVGDGKSHYVSATGVHGIIESCDKAAFRETLRKADLVVPDGMPVVWCLRRVGFKNQKRVYGPDLMLHVLEEGAKRGWRIGLYGAKESTLELLKERMEARFPSLNIVYSFSPPYRALSAEETSQIRTDIGEADVQVLFVGLGAPKQDIWIENQLDHIACTMLAVGAAFDFHAGTLKKAPSAVQNAGLEWLFRLLMEPKRLWKRYASIVPRFIVKAIPPRAVQRLEPRIVP
jgi:N-acetylglucosaminyldiphosphoundecaprenol N-acetyl-beta-D-mannosaminyltransferase